MKCYAIFLPLCHKQHVRIMGNKTWKVLYAAFMAAVVIAIIVFMIIHLRTGNAGQYANLITGGYVVLLIWAVYRCYTIIKNLRS